MNKHEDNSRPKLIFPKIAPEKLTGEYLASKIATKALRRYPKWDLSRADPSMNVAIERRKLHQSELKLLNTKGLIQERQENCRKQWEEIEEIANSFCQRFLEFEEMIIQNEGKRNRAKKKIQTEIARQEEQSLINEDMKAIIEILQKHKDKMEHTIQQHKIYEEYLEHVAKESVEFNSARDVYDKIESFTYARNLMTEKLSSDILQLENIKNDMVTENSRQVFILMGLSNRVAELQDRYNTAKFNAENYEEMVRDIQTVLKEKILDIFKAKQAVFSIYLELCKRKKQAPKSRIGEFEEQLLFIKCELLRMKKVIENAQQKEVQDCSSPYKL